MNTLKTLPRIDRYTCRFENPVIEDQFKALKWSQVRKVVRFGVFFLCFMFIGDGVNTYQSFGEFHPLLLIFPFFVGLFLSFFWMPETWKQRHFDAILATFFLGYHFSQVLFAHIFPEKLVEMGVTSKLFLQFTPTLLMLICILLPLNFLLTVVTVLLFLLSLLEQFSNIESVMGVEWGFLLIFPLVVLLFNKYNIEYGARMNFATTASLDETQELMQQTLRRYFGDALSDKMLNEGGDIKGENKWVSISFTDIKSYSTITENMSPEVTLEFLNQYFSAMHEVIKEYNGHILNYIGDAVMIVFGAPVSLKNHENQAVLCAIKMQERLRLLNEEWDADETSRYWKNHGIEVIGARTGIHSGSVMTGNIGSRDMLQYTTIGDVVNVAARLEQSNKDFGTDISFSHEVYTALTRNLHQRAVLSGEIQLKGRSGSTKVYTIEQD